MFRSPATLRLLPLTTRRLPSFLVSPVSALLVGAGRGWRVIGVLMRVPGLHWLSGVVYRCVARNRYRLPGGTAACALPRH